MVISVEHVMASELRVVALFTPAYVAHVTSRPSLMPLAPKS